MSINEADIRVAVWDAIRKTINKFREQPFYFFTESDIHSYFYCSSYSSNFEVKRDNKPIYLIHREYPTNFRYYRDDLLNPDFKEPYPLSEKKGGRGKFDVAVLNPSFVLSAPSIEDIFNKNVRLVEERIDKDLEAVQKEILFAIEFKYINGYGNLNSFTDEIIMDNKKLEFCKKWGGKEAVNLVFCNMNLSDDNLKNVTLQASPQIHAFFIQSYYEADKKITPSIKANKNDSIDLLNNII